MAASTSGLAKPQEQILTTVPYPSPPSSPRPVRTTPANVAEVFKDEPRPTRNVIPAPPSPPATPSQRRPAKSTPPVAGKPNQNKEQAISALKTRLGMDSGLCGGLTKKNTPCKWDSSAVGKDSLPSLLASMTDLTQGSPELNAKLDELASQWHCHWHQAGDPKKARIKAWRAQFPAGKAADTAALIEERIRDLLYQKSTQCIGVNSKGERCGRKHVGGEKRQNYNATMDKIVRPRVYLNDDDLDYFLNVLETNMYCMHHERQPLKMVEGWKSAIEAIRGIHSEEPKARESSATEGKTTPSRPSRTSSSSVSPTKHGTSSSSLPRGGPSPSRRRPDPRRYWPKKYDTSPFHIVNKDDALAGSQHTRVKDKLLDVLDKTDQEDGYVYAFEDQGNPGYVKIGYTGRSVEERHDEWRFECNREPQALYPSIHGTITKVRNASRVEALCHEDLGHKRVRIFCSACNKNHVEWFEVSAADAIAVITKWSKWTATKPYEPISVGLRSGEKHTIREVERKRTNDMETFMRQISDAAKSAVDTRVQVGGTKVEAVKVAKVI